MSAVQRGGGGRFGRLLRPARRAVKHAVKAADDSVAAAAAATTAAAAAAGSPVTGSAAEASTVRVVAVADWAGMSGAMSFSSGEAGQLVYASHGGWLCVRVGERTGWVPADYWRIVTDVCYFVLPSPRLSDSLHFQRFLAFLWKFNAEISINDISLNKHVF